MNENEILRVLNRLEDKVDSICTKLGAPNAESANIIDLPGMIIETQVDNEEILAQELGIKSAALLKSEFELRFKSWTYKWYCNVFNNCDTTYSGRVFAIRKSTGQIIEWNLIESATRKDHGLPFGSTSPYYKYARNSTEVDFGFGNENGRSCHVSTCINCYANWGNVRWRWDETAC